MTKMVLYSMDSRSLTDDYEFYSVAIYVLFVLSLLIALENILVVVSVAYFTPKNYSFSPFICSASIMDILQFFGPVSLSLHAFITKTVSFEQDETLCKIQSWLIVFLRMSSTLSILMLSIERCLSVVEQNFHRKKWNGAFVIVVVFACWVFSAFISSWPLFGVGDAKPVSFCPHIYCLFTKNSVYSIVFASIQLFCVGLSTACSFYATNSSKQSLFRASYSSSTGKMAVQKTRHLVQEQFNQKVSKMAALVVGIYSFCLVPWLICLYLDYFLISYPQIYGLLSFQLPMVSGLCNPIVYGIIWPPFRRAYEQALTGPLRMYRKRYQSPRPRDIEASSTSRSYSFWTMDRMNADHQVSTIDRLFGTTPQSHEPIDLMPHELRMFENEGLNTDAISIDVSSPNLHESASHMEADAPVAATNIALDNSAQFQSILDLIEEMTEGKTKATISTSQPSLQKCRRKTSKISNFRAKNGGSNVSSIDRSALKYKVHAQNGLASSNENGCTAMKMASPNEEKDFLNSSMNSAVSSCVCLGKSKCYKLDKETRYLDYLVNTEIKEMSNTSDAVVFIDK